MLVMLVCKRRPALADKHRTEPDKNDPAKNTRVRTSALHKRYPGYLREPTDAMQAIGCRRQES
jgi:hypothetical protein